MSIREIARWWPLVVAVTLIAVCGGVWSSSRHVSTYTATTRVVLATLPQWEDTFIGTSLLHESGDVERTTATAAAILSSRRAATLAAEYLGGDWTPDSVAEAVKVAPLQDANVIEIVAKARQPALAAKIAEGYAKATMQDRWRTISAELDKRIAAMSAEIAAGPPDSSHVRDAYTALRTIQLIRSGDFDPTMKIDSTSAPVEVAQMSTMSTAAVAAAGGLCVGVFAAIGAALLRRRMGQPAASSPQHSAAAAGLSSNRGR
ncbi:hypothetical protein [Mycobacterium aquaticum]|uniref:Polysaccharide chain length determinant N-terminal domain-containing protein n=1 Tax=Mycobacterium aquaticum TaxID=1927124 RepID=A0A1X0ABB8_9MYCO|nr:hypothetical protein [Mycobacterium aquaticum]ORA26996.1 hypothetical protein BST13_31125 [Mycobacterium aquaticum]